MIELEKSTSFRLVHPWNALSYIVVIVSGKETNRMLISLRKALSPIATTLFPSISLGIVIIVLIPEYPVIVALLSDTVYLKSAAEDSAVISISSSI